MQIEDVHFHLVTKLLLGGLTELLDFGERKPIILFLLIVGELLLLLLRFYRDWETFGPPFFFIDILENSFGENDSTSIIRLLKVFVSALLESGLVLRGQRHNPFLKLILLLISRNLFLIQILHELLVYRLLAPGGDAEVSVLVLELQKLDFCVFLVLLHFVHD